MRLLPGIVAVCGLSACATVAPPPPAVLAVAARQCAAAPDLSRAISLTPIKERALYNVATEVGPATPCIRRDGRDTAYVLYELPVDFEDKTLTVGGCLEALRILSPQVAVLNAHGETSRSFRPEEFMYRGLNYSVLFRPRPGDRYVLVTVDPGRIGQSYDSIAIGTSTTTTYTAYGSASFTVGSDASMSRAFSYEGTVQVAVNDSDTAEAPPAP